MMPMYHSRVDQAKLVLGNQPSPPRTIGLRYLSTEVSLVGLELVSAEPYYLEPKYPSAKPIDHAQEMQLVEHLSQGEGESRSLMLVQILMRPRMLAMRKAGPCFGCGGNYWLRDCPDKLFIN